MPKFTHQELESLIHQAGEQFTLSASHKTALRRHLMDVIKSQEIRTRSQHIINPRIFAMPLIPIIVAILLAFGGGTAALADTAKPGDTLYPLDQWMENMQNKLTSSTDGKARLMATLSEERLAELEQLNKIDPTQLEAKAKALWEEHQQEAVQRLTASIERVKELQTQFQTKLDNATTPEQKAVFQKIIDHLKTVEAKREERLTKVNDKTFPGLAQRGTLGQVISQYRQEHKAELNEVRDEVKDEIKDLLAKEDEHENEAKDQEDNTTTNTTPPPANNDDDSSDATQTSVEMRIPRDKNGNIDLSLIDTDHDGSPDNVDPYPGWPPYTL